MLNRSRTLFLFSSLAILLVLLLIIPFYLFFDLQIAKSAYGLKGTFWVTGAKAISLLASKHAIQTISFAVLIAGAVDALAYGLSMRARSLLLVGMSSMTAMLIGDELKWFFGRCRPPLFFEDGSYGFTWFSGKGIQNSFPSGHTLRAFSVATAVALVLPRLRFPAIFLAVLVGVSRVVAGRHYPSDVMFGCLIGIVCAVWSFHFLFPVDENK